MSTSRPFGWDLPPGVTNQDIERAMGGDYCESCGLEECECCLDCLEPECVCEELDPE